MKIFLDVGHGGEDSGANFQGLDEKDVVLDICLACFERLQLFHWVALSRTADVYVPLSNRALEANYWGADLFVSVHCNADPDPDYPDMPEAKGEEIWVYSRDSDGYKVAETIKDHVDSFFQTHPFRGIKESKNLYVLRKTKMPALLVETGFIDSINEHEAFKDLGFKRGIGLALARGILEYDRGQPLKGS